MTSGRDAGARRPSRGPIGRNRGNETAGSFWHASIAQAHRGQARSGRPSSGILFRREVDLFADSAPLADAHLGCPEGAMSRRPRSRARAFVVDPQRSRHTFPGRNRAEIPRQSNRFVARAFAEGHSGGGGHANVCLRQAAIGGAYNELVTGFGALAHTLCFAVKSERATFAILKYLAGGQRLRHCSGGELQFFATHWRGRQAIVFRGGQDARGDARGAAISCHWA